MIPVARPGIRYIASLLCLGSLRVRSEKQGHDIAARSMTARLRRPRRLSSVLAFLALLTAAPARLTAAPHCELAPTGVLAYAGGAWSIRIAGDILALVSSTNEPEIALFDVSDASSPRPLSTLPTNSVSIGVSALTSKYLAWADGATVYVYDVSCPTLLLPIGTVSFGGWTIPRDISIDGDLLYVVTAEGETSPPLDQKAGLWVYDLRLPNQPLSQIGKLNISSPQALIVYNQFVYVITGTEILAINATNAGAPSIASRTPTVGSLVLAAASGLLVTAGFETLESFSLADPAHPEWLARVEYAEPGNGNEHRLILNESRATLLSFDMHVFDLLDPSQPALLKTQPRGGTTLDIAQKADWIFAAENRHVELIDQSQCLPTPPRFPVVAHAHGASGTQYRTDLYLANHASESKVVTLEFWPRNELSPRRLTTQITLAPNENRVVADALADLFGIDAAAGPLTIYSSKSVQSQIYLRAVDNRFGSLLRPETSWEPRRLRSVFEGAIHSEGMTANLIIVNRARLARATTIRRPNGEPLHLVTTPSESSLLLRDFLSGLPTPTSFTVESDGPGVDVYLTETSASGDFSLLPPSGKEEIVARWPECDPERDASRSIESIILELVR